MRFLLFTILGEEYTVIEPTDYRLFFDRVFEFINLVPVAILYCVSWLIV